MAKENLMPIEEVNSNRTREQHSADSRKGGIRSGEVRREKATMKATLEMLLDQVANIKDNENKLTYRQLTTVGLLKGAIEGKAENYKTIVQLLGELQEQVNETPSLNITITDNSNLEKALYSEENEEE